MNFQKTVKETAFFIIVLGFGFVNQVAAQEQYPGSDAGIGIQLNQYQDDFGMGVVLTSPFIANQKLAFRFRGNIMFHEHPEEDETTWTPYTNASAGLIGVAGWVGESIRLYSEGGIIGLFPSPEFSSDDFIFGGYGLFGFEFFMNSGSNYFIEIGGMGTGAKADLVENSPIFSNGLTISTGFRIHL